MDEVFIYSIINNPEKEYIVTLAEEVLQFPNYAKKTLELNQKQLYDRVTQLSEELDTSWEEAKKLLKDIHKILHGELWLQYKNLLENPSDEAFLAFIEDHQKTWKVFPYRYPELARWIENYTDSECESFEERILCIRRNQRTLSRCPYCAKPIHNLKNWTTYTCLSKECESKHISQRQKNHTPEEKAAIQEKMRKTSIERYGVPNANQCRAVREKMEANNLRKYGVKYTTQVESAKQKKKQTFLEKYGCDNPMKAEVVRNKAKATLLEKYGVENIKQSQYIKDLFQERYGVDNANLIGKNPECIEIAKNPTLLEKYFTDHPTLSLAKVASSLGFSSYYIATNLHKFGLDRFVGIGPGTSNEERSLEAFVKTLIPEEEIKAHDRTVCAPLELDLYIPSKKLAIEYNGNFWHSEASVRDRNYHLHKSQTCEKQNIHLIHIFEYEWTDPQKRPLIENYLRDLLSKPEVVYGRKCSVLTIPSAETKNFLNNNHLQGYIKAPITYGLFYNEELVGCMSFSKPRFNKNYEWEIARFAIKSGLKIPGAAGKLLKAFREDHEGSIITYSDRAKMTGATYRAIGFTELKASDPGYVWTKGNEVLLRYQTQKHKLLEQGFEGATETEIMHNRGFYRIYDCGNFVFELL